VIDSTKRTLLFVIAVISGVLILLGYFIDNPLLISVRDIILNWAIILGAVGLLIGLINLIQVHARKVIRGKKGAPYSLILLFSFVITFGVGIIFGPSSSWSIWLFNHILVPTETSIVALLAIILILAVIRVLARKQSGFFLIFIITIIIILIGSVTVPWVNLSWLNEARNWITRIPVAGGARGLLIGIVLGTIATGLRVLVGSDRPYED
jgi:hypothetical protein